MVGREIKVAQDIYQEINEKEVRPQPKVTREKKSKNSSKRSSELPVINSFTRMKKQSH